MDVLDPAKEPANALTRTDRPKRAVSLVNDADAVLTMISSSVRLSCYLFRSLGLVAGLLQPIER